MGVYLSASFRVLANVEALNAVESLGNIIRHRKATIIVVSNGRKVITQVPAISGEAIRHGYQALLAQLAEHMGLNVCPLCRMGEFVKHGVTHENIKKLEPGLWDALTSKGKSITEKELEVMRNCVVEDIGGFLIPLGEEELQPIKRTSRFEASYMIPAISDIKYVGVDAQFHVRNAGQTQQLTGQGAREQAQSIYYVESASAVYTFTFNIDLTSIGVTANCLSISNNNYKYECKSLDVNERKKRVELAINALAELVKNGFFGGKHSSYNPHWIPLSGVAALTRPIKVNVMPGHATSYIIDTLNMLKNGQELLRSADGKSILEYEVFTFITRQGSEYLDQDVYNVVRDNEELSEKVKDDVGSFFLELKKKALEWFDNVVKTQGANK